jgi:hypothetical protein
LKRKSKSTIHKPINSAPNHSKKEYTHLNYHHYSLNLKILLTLPLFSLKNEHYHHSYSHLLGLKESNLTHSSKTLLFLKKILNSTHSHLHKSSHCLKSESKNTTTDLSSLKSRTQCFYEIY